MDDTTPQFNPEQSQPAAGQPAAGQTPTGQSATSQTSYGQPAAGQTPPAQAPYGTQQPPAGYPCPPQGAYSGAPAGYPPYPAGYPGYPYPYQAPTDRWNGMCIAGFVTAFIVPPVGLVLSIIALVQINKSHEKSKGMAIAGTVIGAVFTLLLVAVIAFTVWMIGFAIDHADDIMENAGSITCDNGFCYDHRTGDMYGYGHRGNGYGTDDYAPDYDNLFNDFSQLNQEDMQRLLQQYS